MHQVCEFGRAAPSRDRGLGLAHREIGGSTAEWVEEGARAFVHVEAAIDLDLERVDPSFGSPKAAHEFTTPIRGITADRQQSSRVRGLAQRLERGIAQRGAT